MAIRTAERKQWSYGITTVSSNGQYIHGTLQGNNFKNDTLNLHIVVPLGNWTMQTQ